MSGFLGASARMVERRGALSPIWTRAVLGSTFGWVAVNLVMAFTHYAPGMGEVQVAWEAHLVGLGRRHRNTAVWRGIDR